MAVQDRVFVDDRIERDSKSYAASTVPIISSIKAVASSVILALPPPYGEDLQSYRGPLQSNPYKDVYFHGHQGNGLAEPTHRAIARIPSNNLPIPVPGYDLPDDYCGDTAARFPNGICHALLRQGPCQDPFHWVTLNPSNFKVRELLLTKKTSPKLIKIRPKYLLE